MNDVALADLPETARDLADLVGLPATLRLVRQLGGTSFPVAKGRTRMGVARFELLAEVVGEEAAETITRHYGGEVLYVPRCHAALQRSRDRAIHARFDERIHAGASANQTVAELAREHQLSDRRVWDILKTLPEPVCQNGLFD